MHRAMIEACLPCLLALAGSLAVLRLVVRASGARFEWGKLRRVHTCQDGGVQSLAFVLTVPFFITIVLFIVQVSQLMIGTVMVHYAAFAAARAAAVWIPADVTGEDPPRFGANRFPLPPAGSVELEGGSEKHRKIFTAAVLACVPISPSRPLGFEVSAGRLELDVLNRLYASMAPGSRREAPLERKFAYSLANTRVRLEFMDKDSSRGPTYNPQPPPLLPPPPPGAPPMVWNPHEVGWQDPLTVTVTHDFALLPGPGRFLARHLVPREGQRDRVSPRIDERQTPGGAAASGSRIYTTAISASATMTVEGFKPVIPHVQNLRLAE